MTMDNMLIAEFLEENFEAFQEHLDRHGIEPTEAELIIEKLKDDQ